MKHMVDELVAMVSGNSNGNGTSKKRLTGFFKKQGKGPEKALFGKAVGRVSGHNIQPEKSISMEEEFSDF
jgi:hypothetical protein